MIKINCPLCNYHRSRKLLSLGHKLFPINISICNTCGFVFQNPRFSEQEWESYYESDYDRYGRPLPLPNTKPEDPYKNGKAIFSRLKDKKLTTFKSILDIGAGKGDILDYYNKQTPYKMNLLAIEPSKNCQNKLKNLGIKVIGSSINEFDEGYLGKIDIIIMRGVLEHLYNPVESISIAKSLLSEDGIIYFDVPNPFCDLFSYGNIPFGFPHISYFNKITLELLCEKTGLSIISLEEKEDILYGIFNKGKVQKINSEKLKVNYLLTEEFIRKSPVKRSIVIKRMVSYLIPRFLIRKYIYIKHRRYVTS